MEVEMLEDDLFFAELSKRISLLITDDDEADLIGAAAAAQFPAAVPVQGFSLSHVPTMGGATSMLAPPSYTLFHHGASYGGAGAGGDSARVWQQCGSKGTGVFIPRSSPGAAHAKRKGRSKNGAAANKTKAAGAAPAKIKQSSHK